jgi:hypothetical protein
VAEGEPAELSTSIYKILSDERVGEGEYICRLYFYINISGEL